MTNSQKSHLNCNICKPHSKLLEKKKHFSSGNLVPFTNHLLKLFFMLYTVSWPFLLFYLPIIYSISFCIAVSHFLTLSSFLSASVLRLPSLKLSLFSLSVSLCLSLSPTHYCSSLPPAHLQRPFFSFLFSSLFMAVTVRAAVTLQTGFAAHTLTVCFQSFDPTTVNQPLS